jgi:hypothetical protein
MNRLFKCLQSEQYPSEGEYEHSDEEFDESLAQGNKELSYSQLVQDIKWYY